MRGLAFEMAFGVRSILYKSTDMAERMVNDSIIRTPTVANDNAASREKDMP